MFVYANKPNTAKGSRQNKNGKISDKKEGGGSGQNHDLRFLLNSDKSQRGGSERIVTIYKMSLCVF